jgi:proline iminopeptidase
MFNSAIFVLAFYCALAGCVSTEPFRDATGHILPHSIAVMEQHAINGSSQRLWFRGTNIDNPVLILLHGGPGISESGLFRHYNAELEQHFLVVYWEQRGAGRSYHSDIPVETMTIDQFVKDLETLVQSVKNRFGKQKVVLLGHSWGTVLGIIYAHRHPENVAAYVGTGQMVNPVEGERLSYEWALARAQQNKDKKAIAGLRKLGPAPYDVKQKLELDDWVDRFGGQSWEGPSKPELIGASLMTDEMNLIDLVRFGQGNAFSLKYLHPQLHNLDLEKEYIDFAVPVFFLIGQYDWNTPAPLAERYFNRLCAPFKRLIRFKRSAHNVPFEEPDAFNRVLIEQVLPVIDKFTYSLPQKGRQRPECTGNFPLK